MDDMGSLFQPKSKAIRPLMTLEIIKGFFTIAALVHGLTGRRAKLAYQAGIVGATAGALHGLFGKHFADAELLLLVGWGNAVGF
jgi:hypothetical protein